jgi:hypothetical protein
MSITVRRQGGTSLTVTDVGEHVRRGDPVIRQHRAYLERCRLWHRIGRHTAVR